MENNQKSDVAIGIIALVLIPVIFVLFVHLILNAVIKEQEFNDNIRRARCESMAPIEQSRMKGYCNGL